MKRLGGLLVLLVVTCGFVLSMGVIADSEAAVKRLRAAYLHAQLERCEEIRQQQRLMAITGSPVPRRAAWPGKTADFVPADLDFFKPTVSEDPTQLVLRLQVGMLVPDGHAYVQLSVMQVCGGQLVGDRQLVRRLRMPLDDVYRAVQRAGLEYRIDGEPVRLPDRTLFHPGLPGVDRFITGFAGFPTRSEL